MRSWPTAAPGRRSSSSPWPEDVARIDIGDFETDSRPRPRGSSAGSRPSRWRMAFATRSSSTVDTRGTCRRPEPAGCGAGRLRSSDVVARVLASGLVPPRPRARGPRGRAGGVVRPSPRRRRVLRGGRAPARPPRTRRRPGRRGPRARVHGRAHRIGSVRGRRQSRLRRRRSAARPLVAAPAWEAHRTERTKAVIVVHLYGRPAEPPATDLPVVDDAAQAHGALLPGPGERGDGVLLLPDEEPRRYRRRRRGHHRRRRARGRDSPAAGARHGRAVRARRSIAELPPVRARSRLAAAVAARAGGRHRAATLDRSRPPRRGAGVALAGRPRRPRPPPRRVPRRRPQHHPRSACRQRRRVRCPLPARASPSSPPTGS